MDRYDGCASIRPLFGAERNHPPTRAPRGYPMTMRLMGMRGLSLLPHSALASSLRTQTRCSFVTLKGGNAASEDKPKSKKYLRDPSLRVRIVSMFEDNYGYIVVDEANQTMFAIDPAEPAKILPVLKEEETNQKREFLGILTTHKHWDHAGGNQGIADKYPKALVAGPAKEEIPARNKALQGGEKFKVGASKVKVLSVPCHTAGHLAYVVTGDPDTPPLLFPGDTLFIGGCGRFFEGTAEDMYRALYEVILTLPKDTRVYCGHEYTMSNLRFALSVDPSNAVLREKIAQVKIRRSKNLPSVPSTLREEMQYNPFLRVHEEVIRNAVGGSDPVSVLDHLRRQKDSFQ